jgi:hypothetical protein
MPNLTLRAIANDWGVSKPYVHKCVKKGCPTDSLEKARLWREAHAMSKAPTSPTTIQKLIDKREDDSPKARKRRTKYLEDRERPDLPKDVAIEDALISARQAQQEAWRLLQESMIEGKISKISPLLAIHNKALEAMFKAEQSYREELERRNVLIEVSVANEMARKGYALVIARLSSLPQNVAPRCNPANPNHAMEVLEAECAEILADVRRIYADVSNTS